MRHLLSYRGFELFEIVGNDTAKIGTHHNFVEGDVLVFAHALPAEVGNHLAKATNLTTALEWVDSRIVSQPDGSQIPSKLAQIVADDGHKPEGVADRAAAIPLTDSIDNDKGDGSANNSKTEAGTDAEQETLDQSQRPELLKHINKLNLMLANKNNQINELQKNLLIQNDTIDQLISAQTEPEATDGSLAETDRRFGELDAMRQRVLLLETTNLELSEANTRMSLETQEQLATIAVLRESLANRLGKAESIETMPSGGQIIVNHNFAPLAQRQPLPLLQQPEQLLPLPQKLEQPQLQQQSQQLPKPLSQPQPHQPLPQQQPQLQEGRQFQLPKRKSVARRIWHIFLALIAILMVLFVVLVLAVLLTMQANGVDIYLYFNAVFEGLTGFLPGLFR